MSDLKPGQSMEMQGSGSKPYVLKCVSVDTYTCSCLAWRNQSAPTNGRTCKHLKKLRGELVEAKRCGLAVAEPKEENESKDVPPLLLAKPWDRVLDPTGWFLSIKLDGNRCYWNGETAISRLGNKIHMPAWYTKSLPKVPLDGELWIKRGDFANTSGLCRRQDEGEYWREIKFMVFDLPASLSVFEDRYEQLVGIVKKTGFENLRHLEQTKCRGMSHLMEALRREESLGGEGMMLRQAGSFYVAGRSSTLLKVKNVQETDAKVVGYTPGKGKYLGMTGALECVLKNGVQFCVSPGPDENRRNPPKIGTIINIHMKELSKEGVPREPTFHGIRHDIKW